MNKSSNFITNQPSYSNKDIISYLDKSTTNNTHKTKCEQFCTCNSTANRCPVNCKEYCNTFKLYEDSHGHSFGLYSCLCFPVTLPVNTILCGPCTLYNISRNKCNNNTESKNYLC